MGDCYQPLEMHDYLTLENSVPCIRSLTAGIIVIGDSDDWNWQHAVYSQRDITAGSGGILETVTIGLGDMLYIVREILLLVVVVFSRQ